MYLQSNECNYIFHEKCVSCPINQRIYKLLRMTRPRINLYANANSCPK